MGFLDFTASIISSLAWPATVVFAARLFSGPMARLIDRVKTAKISREGLSLDTETLQRVIEGRATPEEVKMVEDRSVGERGVNANGSYTLYSNRTVVARLKAELKAGTRSRSVTLPIHMPNEVTSIQVVGAENIRVERLTASQVDIGYDPLREDCTIELVVTGI